MKSYLFLLTVTDKRFLPLVRLLLMTFLPPAVAILFKKPWVLFLFFFPGLYVGCIFSFPSLL